MPKKKVKIIEILRKTDGGKHCWLKAEIDGIIFNIRKPNSSVKLLFKGEK